MKLHFYCGCYKKLTSFIDEPEDCEVEGEIEVDEEEWKNGDVCINCPSCNAELHQNMDHFKIINIAVKQKGYQHEKRRGRKI